MSGWSGHQITLPLEDEDDFCNGNLSVCRRPVALAVEFRGVRFALLEHVVDCRKEHSGNEDDGFLVSTVFLECEIAGADFRELFVTNGTESTLNKQRLDVSSGPADSGGFLLSSTLVVLPRKPGPGAKILRGGEHGHIHSNFRNDIGSSKGLDVRYRRNKVELRKIFFSSG